MAKSNLKWKEEFFNQIKKYDNEQLLEECMWAAGGDDYDGCFTDRGQWQYGELQVELYRKLIEVRFLKE
jgi:hypothetical protein